MSVHYKFKSALEYDTVTFDGLHISIADLKAAILQQKRIGKTSDFDLQITNAQTKEVYSDNNALIPKNTSLLVARIPVTQQVKKSWDGVAGSVSSRLEPIVAHKGTTDLSRMEGTEDDKIMAMISQSTLDYDPSNYQKIRGANQRGEVPPNYRCYRCHEPGHWIKNCPLGAVGEQLDIKRSTGIPRSFMVPVDGPDAPGAMITPTGSFAVPVVDHEAYQAEEAMMEAGGGTNMNAPEPSPRQEIPEDLICSLCRDLLTDAVMIPCCGNSFCDECIRGVLLDSEDHECPDCREKDISPVTLIPNRFLRSSVTNFRNQTGYCPRPRPPPAKRAKTDAKVEAQPPHSTDAHQQLQPHSESDNVVSGSHNGASATQRSHGIRSPSRRLSREDQFEDSDGSYDDNITVKVPPLHSAQSHGYIGGGHSNIRPRLKPPGMETPPNQRHNVIGEERSGTPTVDEREPRSGRNSSMHHSSVQRRQNFPHLPPANYSQTHMHSNASYDYAVGGSINGPPPPFGQSVTPYPPVYQPVTSNMSAHVGVIEDPLEAFERMIKEKEEKARRREKRSRTRTRSSTRSRTRSRSRSRYTRSRSRVRSRTPYSRSRSRSRPGSGRSPLNRRPAPEKYRSYSRSPVPRRAPPPPPRRRSRERRSNSFSMSRSRSASRSRSPRSGRPLKRRGSPTHYHSPLHTPPPQGPPPHQRPRFVGGLPYKPPGRSGSQERLRALPPNGPRPQRHFTGYNAGPAPGPGPTPMPHNRYNNQRNSGPAGGHPPLLDMKMMPPGVQTGPRMRYGPPVFEDIPPGTQPPPPGFEHPPLDRREDMMPNVIDRGRERDRSNANYRDQRPPFRDGPPQNFKDPQMGYREGISPNFREGPQQVFRDNINTGYRDHPPSNYRESSTGFREGQPSGFRDGPPQGFRDNTNFREGPPGPFRDGNQNVRDNAMIMQPYRDNSSNYRDGGSGFRDGPMHSRENMPQLREPNVHTRENMSHMRENFSHITDISTHPRGETQPHPRDSYLKDNIHKRRGTSHNRDGHFRGISNISNRDNIYTGHEKSNRDHLRQDYSNDRNRDYREQERSRDERRDREYERNYERGRDDRYREYDKNRDQSERDHGSYYVGEKRRRTSVSPKRDNKEERSKIRGVESRGRSRESMDYKKELKKDHDKDKKFDDERNKEREKKIKDKKKKKKEKDEKRKKKDKKDKKDKNETEKSEVRETEEKQIVNIRENENDQSEAEKNIVESSIPDLYNDILSDGIDRNIIETYVKDNSNINVKLEENSIKESGFESSDSKVSNFEHNSDNNDSIKEKKNEVLAPVPELSKWEMDEEQSVSNDIRDHKDATSPTVKSGKVTSEVLKRAENAIFAKAINAIRPIEIKKISLDRAKLYSNETIDMKQDIKKEPLDLNVTNLSSNISEVSENCKMKHEKTPPPKLSIKERLGGKVEEPSRRNWDERILHSTVERIKSRSRTPPSRRQDKESHRRIIIDASREKGSYRHYISKTEDIDIHADDHRTYENRKESRKGQPERHDSHHSHDKKKIRSDENIRNRDQSPYDRSKHFREDRGERKEKTDRHHNRSESIEGKTNKKRDKRHRKEKEDKKNKKEDNDNHEAIKEIPKSIENEPVSTVGKESVSVTERERKKSSLDEASFEPDYDETVESDIEGKEANENSKKTQVKTPEKTDNKTDNATIQLELSNWKKRPHSESSSSSSESTSSSSSSGSVHKRKKKKRTKAKKKKSKPSKDSATESDNSTSDEPKKKKKKRKNKKKNLKKKKKSKHK